MTEISAATVGEREYEVFDNGVRQSKLAVDLTQLGALAMGELMGCAEQRADLLLSAPWRNTFSGMTYEAFARLWKVLACSNLNYPNVEEIKRACIVTLYALDRFLAQGRGAQYRYDIPRMPWAAIVAVAGVMTKGAQEYGDMNWHGIPWRSCLSHWLMHLLNVMMLWESHPGSGEITEELSHAAARGMMTLELVHGDFGKIFGQKGGTDGSDRC